MITQATATDRILRLPEVKEITGLSGSTIYAWVTEGKFPKPINLGNRSVGWLQSEVVAWIKNRIRLSRSECTVGAKLPQIATSTKRRTG